MTVSRHERGESPMTTQHMQAYAAVLEIRPEDLLPSSAPVTSERIRALVELASGLPPEMQDQLIRLGHALAEPPARYEPEQSPQASGQRRKKR